jgi:ATP-dependent DNA ligase
MLPIEPPFAPMEALPAEQIPAGPDWQYEPKWDGFRCLVFKDGDTVHLQSKKTEPLARFFPELVAALEQVKADRFVIDGEIVVPAGAEFSFDALLQRIHPAASRIAKLAKETPAKLIVFDLLVVRGKNVADQPLRERRRMLEILFPRALQHPALELSPASTQLADAEAWLQSAGAVLDGIVAKRLDLAYRSGERTGMKKIKKLRTADCVVGGFRYAAQARIVGSLLLGLYNHEGLLDHIGFTSGFSQSERKRMLEIVEPLIEKPGFSGKAPGGPSRWSNKRSMEWLPLKPELVVEVQYDHFTGNRFRHGAKMLRWRPDKTPRACTFDQVARRRAEPSLNPRSQS